MAQAIEIQATMAEKWLLALLSNNHANKKRPSKAVKVKAGGQKYGIWLCFPKTRFEKNAFEVDDGETLLFSQARLHIR